MANMQRSNYDLMRDQAAAAFLRYDQEAMIRKFTLESCEQYLFVTFFGSRYRIERSNGTVTRWDAGENVWKKADYSETMTIYDVLCCSGDGCHASGNMVNLSGLSAVCGGSLAKAGGFYENAGTWLAGKGGCLAKACEALGGVSDGVGEVGYRLEMFPFLPVAVHFWDADEDFPVSLQILVDSNILDFMRFETLMFAVGHLLGRLKALCRA